MKAQFALYALLFSLLGMPFANAQDTASPILLIYDASGSMWQQLDGTPKKALAAEALSTTVAGLSDGRPIALIAYGHREKDNCNDVEWLLSLDNTSREQVTQSVRELNPTGKTPLARSAQMALDRLKAQQQAATLILITDGIESCDGDLCQIVADAKLSGIDFKMHIVGFGIKEETAGLQCAADAGGGQYFDASDTEKLAAALQEATQTTVDDKAENFSLFATKNGQPVDAWIKVYPTDNQKAVAGGRTYRDTAFLAVPAGRFKVEVRPLEHTDIKGTSFEIALAAGEQIHRTVSFDGAEVSVKITLNGEPTDGIAKIYPTSFGRPAATARTYGSTKTMEVNPGTYHLIFEGLKVAGAGRIDTVKNITLAGGTTEELVHDFQTGTLVVGVQTQNGTLIDATVNVIDKALRKNMAGSRTYESPSSNPRSYQLTPGWYEVEVRALGAHSGQKDTFDIEIKPGATVEKVITY